MQRNLELIRDILIDAEAAEPGQVIFGFDYPECPERTKKEILCHVELLIDAGFLEGDVVRSDSGPVDCAVTKITWAGHEFLANAKNDTVWKRVVSEAKEKGTSTSMVVIQGLLAKAAEKFAGL
jgi:hypothetical protein